MLLTGVTGKVLWLFIVTCECTVDNAEWSSEEVERFQQAVVEYDKDFVKISHHVRIIIGLNESQG